jgi:hypothetical protein
MTAGRSKTMYYVQWWKKNSSLVYKDVLTNHCPKMLRQTATIFKWIKVFSLEWSRTFSSVVFLFFFSFFYSYVHKMFGSFLPLTPTPSLNLPHPHLLQPMPSLPSRNYSALISNFVEERV